MLPVRTQLWLAVIIACAFARGSGAFPGDAFSDPEFNLINPYFPDATDGASGGDRSWQDELESRVRAVDEAIAQRDFQAARRQIQHAMSMAPDHDALILRAGQIALMQGRYFVAEDYFSALVQRNPDDGYLRALWGGSLLRVKRTGEALAVLRPLHEQEPFSLLVRFNLALAEYVESKSAQAYNRLDYLNAREVGQFSSWIADEMDALRRILTDEGVKGLCGYVFLGGYHEQADEAQPVDWAVAAGLTDADHDVLLERCRTVADGIWRAHDEGGRGEYEQAMETLGELKEATTMTAPALRLIAFLKRSAGDESDADQTMKRLREAYPTHPRVAMDYAYYLLESDRAKEALDVFRSTLEQHPDDPYGQFGFSCALAATGDQAGAQAVIERLREAAPAHLTRWKNMYQAIFEPVATNP